MTDAAAMLAETVARIVRDHQPPDPWQPGTHADDGATPEAEALARALTGTGWPGLAGEHIDAAVLAAVELGRGLVSLGQVDALLSGSPVVDGLVRHGQVSGRAVELRPGDGLREVEILSLAPAAYGDASAVSVVTGQRPGDDVPDAAGRLAAWRAASVGYLAGLASAAFETCLDHVRSRKAFGATLDAQPMVQSRLADAATALDGIRLLAGREHSWAALSYAATACTEITAACHQLTGALGYTLDYPLQRYSRRARAMRSWAEWAADTCTSDERHQPVDR
ncbi:MAG TPA: acyl-CoA dehydrogenase family protein [Streptosporangiaceae bacterium]